MSDAPLEELRTAQRAIRSRFDDFRGAFGRRDDAAYRVALLDFDEHLRRWTLAQERTLLPALSRVQIPGRDSQRELRLEYVQLRELARFLLDQVSKRAALADVLGLVENLDRRLAAHEAELQAVYFPTAAPALRPEEWEALRSAAPRD